MKPVNAIRQRPIGTRSRQFKIHTNTGPGVGSLIEGVTCWIIWDKRPTGEFPSMADIFELPTNDLTTLAEKNKSRFTILKRRSMCLSGNVDTANEIVAGETCTKFSWYVTLNKAMHFNAIGTGEIADIDTGAMYLCLIGASAPGLTNYRMNFDSKLFFVDV